MYKASHQSVCLTVIFKLQPFLPYVNLAHKISGFQISLLARNLAQKCGGTTTMRDGVDEQLTKSDLFFKQILLNNKVHLGGPLDMIQYDFQRGLPKVPRSMSHFVSQSVRPLVSPSVRFCFLATSHRVIQRSQTTSIMCTARAIDHLVLLIF